MALVHEPPEFVPVLAVEGVLGASGAGGFVDDMLDAHACDIGRDGGFIGVCPGCCGSDRIVDVEEGGRTGMCGDGVDNASSRGILPVGQRVGRVGVGYQEREPIGFDVTRDLIDDVGAEVNG